MNDLDRILSVKKAAQARLLAIPGVHAVGIGFKMVQGQRTPERCIAVFVIKKKPLQNLPTGQVVPAEIDGVKTDIIEQRVPELLSDRTGDPTDLTITVSPDKHVVTLAGKDTPGIGLLAALDFSITPSGGIRQDFNTFIQTTGPQLEDSDTMSLARMASQFANDIQVWATFVSFSAVTASASGNQVTVTPGSGYTAEVTGARVFVLDDHKYRNNPALSGGIKVQAGGPAGWGTLSLIAKTNEPQPKVVALTCQHVVAAWGGDTTNLGVDVSPDQRTITFSGSATAGSAIVLLLDVMPAGPGPSQNFEFFFAPVTETLAQIATKVSDWINGLANPGVTSTHSGAQVTITWGASFIVLARCNVYEPQKPDPKSDLHASISSANVITLTGKVSGNDYGIYVNGNVGGINHSFGTFVNLTEDQALSDIANSLASSLTGLAISGVGASASGAQVTVTGVQEVECIISSDIRAGQPDNSFSSKCSRCCDHRIGRVIRARLDVDVALIHLDAGQKYLAEVAEIGFVHGSHAIADSELPYTVKKRGLSTGVTDGMVQYLHVDGLLPDRITRKSGNIADVLHRYYTDVMSIEPTGPDPFGYNGDSGSPIVNSSGDIVGILFASNGRTIYATPIQQIEAAFDITVATATQLNDIRVVSTTEGGSASAHAESVNSLALPSSPLEKRLHEAELDMAATPAGERYARLFRRHFPEVAKLVNNNRRVATAWQRNGGPQILQTVFQAIQSPVHALPVDIDGKPLAQCLDGLQCAFERYGSPELAADIAVYGPPLRGLAGLTYPQSLEVLRNLEID
ncbi:MAG TPA: hypothetical protein VFT65_07165 [Candidatus Angelobacter sp.]|nr:hypothetical protein [Candidatus Angelobacter sp.]